MPTVAEFAPAKINLALHILGRRPDGYHNLDSIVAFADVGDELHIAPSTEFSLWATGPFAHQLPEPRNNIVHAAWNLASAIAERRGKTLPPVRIDLVKNLPVASGIGGGSADAAAALRGFFNLANIEPSSNEIMAAALELGADVPVCLMNKACRMQGIGDRLTPLPGFQPLSLLLVNPAVAISTASVFEALGLHKGEAHGSKLESLEDMRCWRNDLEKPVSTLTPAIGETLEALVRQRGVKFARMSGSGSTCFAVFENAESMRESESALRLSYPSWWLKRTIVK